MKVKKQWKRGEGKERKGRGRKRREGKREKGKEMWCGMDWKKSYSIETSSDEL